MPGFSEVEHDSVLQRANEFHECNSFPNPDNHQDYGPAISDIVRLDDTWYATAKGEYSTPIEFCPFCGNQL